MGHGLHPVRGVDLRGHRLLTHPPQGRPGVTVTPQDSRNPCPGTRTAHNPARPLRRESNLMTDQPICGYRGDPVCQPPDCGGACNPNRTDTRPPRTVLGLCDQMVALNYRAKSIDEMIVTCGQPATWLITTLCHDGEFERYLC